MESNSEENQIHCSAAAAALLSEQAPEMHLISRGVISIKGKGKMETFWLASSADNWADLHFDMQWDYLGPNYSKYP